MIDHEARERRAEERAERRAQEAARHAELAKATAWGQGLVLASQRLQMRSLPPVVITVDEWGIPHAMEEGPSVAQCILYQDVASECQNYAGAKTLHPGTGPCAKHGGNSLTESVGGAFIMAHAIAQTLDVDPWEAMEVILRRAYTWSAWYNAKLGTVTDDEDLKRGGAAWDWVQGAERTAELVAKYAKICHDMGIAERRMRQVEVEGQMIAQLISHTLHELGMSQADEDRARDILDNQLRAMAQGSTVVVKGELAS